MKHIYMLGAGASKASANTPIGSELVWDYYEDCSTLYLMADSGRPDANDQAARNQEYQYYSEFLSIMDEYFPELDELSKWETAIKTAGTYIPPTKIKGFKQYFIDEFLRLLEEKLDKKSISVVKRLILEHITKVVCGDPNKLYEKFIENLPPDAVLMTTNFDTQLTKKAIGSDIFFDYEIEFDDVDNGAGEYYYKKGGQKVLRLNGSLNWGVCTKCNKLKLFSPHVSAQNYDLERCSMTANCRGQLEPYIVMPHQKYDTRMKAVWTKAAQKLQEATHVTIIGYSFPIYDQEVVNLFRVNTAPNANIVIVDLYDQDMHSNISREDYRDAKEQQLKGIFDRHANLVINLDGFEAYMAAFKNI